MDAIARAAAIYLALMVLFRIAGRRSLAEVTPFDFVLLLIIGEATQQALLGKDFSITNAVLTIVTLLLFDIGLSLAKTRIPALSKWLEGVPTVIVADGKPLQRQMHKARLTEDDVLEAARRLQGIHRLDDIQYAVVEVSGGISIVPRSRAQSAG